jgi:hypothetical protein
MMKKIYLLMLLFPMVLVGCSSKTPSTADTTTSSNQNNSQEISDIEPTLKQTGFVRMQLTDPILYSYLQATNKGAGDFLKSGSAGQAELAKVGRQGSFAKKQKYGISGIVEIVSTNKLSFKSISYNASCGTITFNPTISSNTTKPFASIYSIDTAVTGLNFEAPLPSTLSLTQFDSVSIFCSNKPEEPISTANL